MILAAQQPVYLPASAYFYKMKRADIFLLADDLQYSAQGNFNRCRIKSVNGKTWLTVPVLTKGKGKQSLHQTQIDNQQNWRQKQLRTLAINYGNAAYFDKYWDAFAAILKEEWTNICDLNCAFIHFLQDQLFLKTRLEKISSLNLSGTINARLVAAMKALNCKTYLAEAAYRAFIDLELFEKSDLKVEFIHFTSPKYYQQFSEFLPDLSTIDLLFNEGELSGRILG